MTTSTYHTQTDALYVFNSSLTNIYLANYLEATTIFTYVKGDKLQSGQKNGEESGFCGFEYDIV